MSQLPARPNLVYLRKQARNLLRDFQKGDPDARSRVLGEHPRLTPNSSDAELEDLGLVDMQLVLAREHGFDSWAKMKAHILDATFAAAVQAIGEGDGDGLRALLDAHPDLVNARSPIEPGDEGGYFAGAMLLHYMAGNPTVNPLPDNALEMIEILLDAGADPNATTQQGGTMLGLIASGKAPREKGIQADMIDLLIGRGADPNGGSGSSLEGGLIHGETEACESLHRHGAKVDLRLSAGLGRMDLMEACFEIDGSLNEPAYGLEPPAGAGRKLDLNEDESGSDPRG